MSEEVFGRLNGEWKVGVGGEGRAIVHTGIVGVDGWQLVCRPNHVRGASATEVAHLISAAPDLLMACRAARSAIEYLLSNDDDDPGYADILPDIAAAIAKADGGERT